MICFKHFKTPFAGVCDIFNIQISTQSVSRKSPIKNISKPTLQRNTIPPSTENINQHKRSFCPPYFIYLPYLLYYSAWCNRFPLSLFPLQLLLPLIFLIESDPKVLLFNPGTSSTYLELNCTFLVLGLPSTNTLPFFNLI